MKIRFNAGLAACALALGGCSTTDTVYYTLSMPASARMTVEPWNKPYRLTHVAVPAQVDDTPLVVRQSDDRLMVLTYDRWTAPLADQFENALSQALTQNLGIPGRQKLEPLAAAGALHNVSVDVQRFDMLPGQAALLDVIWQVTSPAVSRSRSQTLTCYSKLQTPAGVGVAALVTAQQKNIALLAEQIAQTLRTSQAAPDARCL